MKQVLFFAVLSFVPMAVQAQATAGVNLHVISASTSANYCMDAAGRSDGSKVTMHTCQGAQNDRWTVTTAADGTAAIIGAGGFCLDVKGGVKATNAGTPVQLWACNFNANQRFVIAKDGTIKEKASGRCLQASADKDGAPIVIQACSGAPTEKWHFEE